MILWGQTVFIKLVPTICSVVKNFFVLTSNAMDIHKIVIEIAYREDTWTFFSLDLCKKPALIELVLLEISSCPFHIVT